MTCARPMETMACGTLCLSYQPNDNLFTHNKHLLYYRDVKECAFLIKIWSQDPGVYDLLAENGMRYVRENFSLKSRLEEVLEYVSG